MSDSSETNRNPVEELAEEFMARGRAGETPSIEEYVERHPELADEIRSMFAALAVVEDLKPSGNGEPTIGSESRFAVPSSLPEIPEYRLFREIGRGGMGIVYEAEHLSLGRRVALKVLPAGPRNDEAAVMRFRQEARAAAAMHHSNIVPVFDVGQTERYNYYAMQYIVGDGLDRVVEVLRLMQGGKARQGASYQCDRSERLAEMLTSAHSRLPSPPHEGEGVVDTATPASATTSNIASLKTRRAYFGNVARIGMEVARALEHAHERGIIHRDIKPSNILLDTDGTAWVADFGLAKAEDVQLTRTGNILGTLRYMSPERFSGSCDARGDVYGLGATLYEMLALTPIHPGDDQLALIDSIKTESPKPLRVADRSIPVDLATIVHKALEKNPGRRYATAQHLADDLQRFLDGRPIQARSTGPLERVGLWARNNKLVASLAAGLCLALMGIAASSAIGAVYYRGAAQRAEAKAAEALAINEFFNVDILGTANPFSGNVDRNTTHLEVLDAAAAKVSARFADQPVLEGQILRTLGEAYVGLAQYDQAEPHLQRAFDLLSRELGSTHTDTMKAALQLGKLYLAAERSESQGLELVRQVYEHRLQTLGPDEALTLDAKLEIGKHLTYGSEEDLSEAVKLLTEVWETRKRILGENHRQTVRALVSLGAATVQVQPSTAVEMLTEALATATDALGPKDILTLEAQRRLGEGLVITDPEKATPVLQECLASCERWLGEYHPQTIQTLEAIPIIAGGPDENAEKLKRRKEVVRRSAVTYGPSSSRTLEERIGVAVSLWELHDEDEARAYAVELREDMVDAFGERHVSLPVVDYVIGRVDIARAEFEAAEARLVPAYALSQEKLGDNHYNTNTLRWGLINVFMVTEQYAKVRPLFEDAVAWTKHYHGEETPAYAWSQHDIASLYRRLEDYEAAETALRKAVEVADRLDFAPDLPPIFRIQLAHTLNKLRKWDEAKETLQQPLAYEGWAPLMRWYGALALGTLAETLMGLDDYEAAEKALLEGVDGYTDENLKRFGIPTKLRHRSTHIQRLIEVYEATENAEQLAKWQGALADLEAGKQVDFLPWW